LDKIVAPAKAIRMPNIYVIALLLLLIWILSGIYIVEPDEQGVVKRFGKLTRTLEPGVHYHLPYPIGTVKKPKVTRIQRFEFGFRTVDSDPIPIYEPVVDEALMLTGDENIIDIRFIVQFKVENPEDYLFNVANPDKTIRDAAEATMREIVGQRWVDDVLTTGRSDIQDDARKALQTILDGFQSGLQVIAVQLQSVQPPEPVRDSFKDVISAREEKSKSIGEAEGYRSDLLPRAKGLAARIELEAEAYKEQKIKQAQGDADRFLAILNEYRKAKEVTRKRLYLETMEDILSHARKLVVDIEKQGALPLLPLQDLIRWDAEVVSKKQ
jgi:membrane protease subunit HflK